MPVILLSTFIKAPVDVVFDLSRNISFHAESMAHTNEKAIAGKTSALINLGETVTWQARHFGKIRSLETKITAMEPLDSFTDEMVSGDFKMMKHEHHFSTTAGGTIMRDIFIFETPYGILGRWVNKLVLASYMKGLLKKRNKLIKEYAENGKWKAFV